MFGLALIVASIVGVMTGGFGYLHHQGQARDEKVAEQISETYGLDVAVEDLHYPAERPEGIGARTARR